MEKESIVPEFVIKKYESLFTSEPYPNIVRTRNVTRDGINTLIEKNKLKWSYSNFVEEHNFIEGLVTWGEKPVLIYFCKLKNDNTYKVHILTNNLSGIDMLIVGLNKFFTIDKI